MIVTLTSEKGEAKLHTLHVPDHAKRSGDTVSWFLAGDQHDVQRRIIVRASCIKKNKVKVNSVVRLIGGSIWIMPPSDPMASDLAIKHLVDDNLVVITEASRAALSEDAKLLHGGRRSLVVELGFGDHVAFTFPDRVYHWLTWHTTRYIEVDDVLNTRWKKIMDRVRKPLTWSHCTPEELASTAWISLGELDLPISAEELS